MEVVIVKKFDLIEQFPEKWKADLGRWKDGWYSSECERVYNDLIANQPLDEAKIREIVGLTEIGANTLVNNLSLPICSECGQEAESLVNFSDPDQFCGLLICSVCLLDAIKMLKEKK